MSTPLAFTGIHSKPTAPVDWDRMAARARSLRRTKAVALYGFLIAVSLPIIVPYFWLTTIAFSARVGVADTLVLWRSMAVLVPAVIAFWLAAILARNRRQLWLGLTAIALVATAAFALVVGRTCTCAISFSWWNRISPRSCAPASGQCAARFSFRASGEPLAIRS